MTNERVVHASLTFVWAFMSLCANVAGHWAAFEGTKAKEAAENAGS